jgi:molybdate transport system substrate-binding protein
MLQRIVHPTDAAAACLHVAAAISVQEVVGQLLAEYALQRPTVRVRAIYGASNELAEHLLSGAPSDIFISADAAPLDRLAAAGLIPAGSRRKLAHNGLTIVGSQQAKAMRRPADLLDRKIKRVAIAEPECPLGMCSHDYLRGGKIYESVKPKLLEVDNSRAVLSAVESGAADAGLAFASDAARSNRLKTLLRIPSAKAGAEYAAAIVGRSSAPRKSKPTAASEKSKQVASQQTEMQRLFDFLTSTAAARTFRRCGFRPSQDFPARE